MQHIKRSLLWLGAALVIVALAAPAAPLASPAAEAATYHGSAPALDYRFHPDGTAAQMQARLAEWLAERGPASAPRPPVDPAQQSQTVAAWTVMVYIAADNNLEGAGLYDLNELELVGSSPDVNLVVEIDRSAEFVDWEGDWTEGRRYYVQQDDDLEVTASPVVESLGEINSGDPDTVADFAIWGITTYPAQKYMLVLWDHGGGWISHASDDATGDDLTLTELTGALDRVVAETGIDQFEVLGFDMCLMGQAEVFQTIAPYARYGIGSQENEPGAGWFYVFVEELVKDPSMNGAQLGQHVVDSFVYFFEEIWGYEELYSLTTVDLGRSAELTAALETFTAAIRANPDAALSPVADARNNTIGYGGFDDPQYYDVWSSKPP